MKNEQKKVDSSNLHQGVSLLPAGGVSWRERRLLKDEDAVEKHHFPDLEIGIQHLGQIS
jgi:hypothetical protein